MKSLTDEEEDNEDDEFYDEDEGNCHNFEIGMFVNGLILL